jgi:hypothetical protein
MIVVCPGHRSQRLACNLTYSAEVIEGSVFLTIALSCLLKIKAEISECARKQRLGVSLEIEAAGYPSSKHKVNHCLRFTRWPSLARCVSLSRISTSRLAG